MKKKNYFSWVNKRLGFFGLLVVLMWIKNMLAYTLDFHLSLENALQHFILIINPIATTLLLLSVGLYVRRKKPAYITMMVIYFIWKLLKMGQK